MVSTLRHVVSETFHNCSRPEWIRHRINFHINKRFQTNLYPGRSGIDILSADWDTLIILDACRADAFESTADLNYFDTYQQVTSKGSATNEWLNQNFTGQYDDIVYVAGMGQPSKHTPDSFVDLIEVWRDDAYDPFKDPEIVTEAARTAHERYPNKRIIVHYLQPHTPFINAPHLLYSLNKASLPDQVSKPKHYDDVDTVWEALGEGYVSKEEVWEAYRENLEVVLPEVYDLVDELAGRIVVSADHGNLFGERTFPIPVKVHGHPPGIRNENLITVPWAVSEGDRRTIRRGTTGSSTEASSREIEDQLRSLGYVN